ncbi:hypothetical protein Q1695_013017 [Nippostrongylus brasiliensis]|nr:hypothetical protein Q1695_013017 [Nippostrongylus brasiliensis]
MFTSGAVEMSRDAEAQVLFVGMGAGFMNTYTHHMYPKINITAVEIEPKMLEIATKWFGLEQDERHRVIIEDGVKFLRRAVENGHKYDAIQVDVCNLDPEFDILCPIEKFLKAEVIDHLSKLINEKGVVIVNTYSKEPAKNKEVEVKHAYMRSFRHCFTYLSPFSAHSRNMIMACSNKERPDGLRGKYVKFANYPKKYYKLYQIL